MCSGQRRLLLSALLPLLLPKAWGDCGPLPTLSHAEPPESLKQQESFSVGSRVTYSCTEGYVKLPLRVSDTIQCLPNSQWSNLPEFCGRSCPSPLHVPFARISQKDEVQNFYPVGTRVSYVCRVGYENSTAQLPTSTCLDNLTWSEVPQLCRRKSCGVPANPQHGEVLAEDHLFSAKAVVVCNPGYTLKGVSPLVWCSLSGNGVAWSELPTCWAISCPPPPLIPNGKHNGSSLQEFTYSSVVMYTCEPGFQLVGHGTLRCGMEKGLNGSWSESAPECRVSTTAATEQTKPSEEKIAENPSWLASVLIPCCIVPPVALGLVAGIILRKKGNKTHSHKMQLENQEKNGRDPPTAVVDAEKQLNPQQPHLCPPTTCHVWSMHQQELHTSLAPPAQPGDQSCVTCEMWLSAQPGSKRIYSVLSIGDKESWSPTGTSIPAQAADMKKDEDTGEAVPEQPEVEQPLDHGSHHTCPICESWLHAHLAQPDNHPVAPREQQQDQGPQAPICSSCTDRLHLCHVHSSTASSPVCPLAREGTPGHLVASLSPSCHLCPICTAATHSHLCETPEEK